ncbi:MAG: lipopolysaccharide kinase InaA family protein [Victivallaceae bacterium]|nr:lipopolysaccharide kinase InaA family protein [Victivallaceae bacterium]
MNNQTTNGGNHADGSGFRFFKNASLQGFVSVKLSPKVLEKLQELDSLLKTVTLVKDSKSTTAGVIEIDGGKYFLKRYNNKNFKRKLKNSVRETRPFKVLRTSQTVLAAGVFAPEVYGALNYRRGLLIEASYLLSSFPESSQLATQVIHDLAGEGKFETFAHKICQVLATIHDAGVMHGDIKISNILIIPAMGGSYEIGLIDFDGSRCYPRKLSAKRRTHDLARLISSYLLTCRHRSLPVKHLQELTDHFARQYHEISGFDLRGERLFRRAEYLTTRVRKK